MQKQSTQLQKALGSFLDLSVNANSSCEEDIPKPFGVVAAGHWQYPVSPCSEREKILGELNKRKHFFYREGCQTLVQVVQRGCGVCIL